MRRSVMTGFVPFYEIRLPHSVTVIYLEKKSFKKKCVYYILMNRFWIVFFLCEHFVNCPVDTITPTGLQSFLLLSAFVLLYHFNRYRENAEVCFEHS